VLDLEPMVAEKPGAVELPRVAASVELDDVLFAYPTAEQVSLASLESVAVLDQTPSRPSCSGVSFRAEPGQLVALVGPVRRRQDDHQPARDAHVRRRVRARSRSAGSTCAT
jgi:ATP-binding cassette subfamily B protein